MKIKNGPSFFIVFIFFLVGFFIIYSSNHLTPSGERSENIKFVKIAGENIKVDLALTETEQMQGLSGRSGLKEGEGMLFVFTYPGKYRFWMKDMNFPIDMIWVGEDLRIVYIKSNALPQLYPEIYGPDVSDGNAKYVLEVVSQFSEEHNLKVGDRVEFVY